MAEAEPLLRRRERRGGPEDGKLAAAGDPRRGGAAWSSSDRLRRAEPGDAAALVALANAVSAEPEAWLISNGWRGVAEERRFLRAVRRHPDAAVYVAELDGEIAGRLSLARDHHPACGTSPTSA